MADLDPLAQDLTPLFELGAPLGRGAYGAVHRARDRSSRREVALKLLHAEHKAATLERFVREATVTARLDHPGIVRVHAVGRFSGSPCIVYELVDGVAFDEALRTLDVPQRAALVRDAAAAVGSAHAQGVLHRDLKPANLLVDRAGRVRVTDFGLASFEGADRLTRTGAMIGTPVYMAPELFSRGSDGAGTAADVWALGVVLYEALTGRLPFDAASFTSLVVQIDKGDVTPPRSIDPRITPALEAVCLRALAGDPTQRQADAGALARALDVALADGRAPARPRPWIEAVTLAAALPVGLAALASRSRPVAPPEPLSPSEVPAEASPVSPVTSTVAPTSDRLLASGKGARWGFWLDAERVLSGGPEEDLRVWSAATGELLHTWRVRADGAVGAYGNVYVKTVDDGAVRRLDPRTGAADHTGFTKIHAFSSAARDRRLALIAETGRLALVVDHSITPNAFVLATDRSWVGVALSPGAGVLALREDGPGDVSVFDVVGEPILRSRLEPRLGAASAVCFVDDTTLVVGTSAGLLLTFDALPGAELLAFAGGARSAHDGSVDLLALSPDGTRLVSVAHRRDRNTELKVWDVASRQELVDQTFDVAGAPESLDVSPDGRWLALGVRDSGIHVLPLR